MQSEGERKNCCISVCKRPSIELFDMVNGIINYRQKLLEVLLEDVKAKISVSLFILQVSVQPHPASP